MSPRMLFHLEKLDLIFRHSTESIVFGAANYFYGQMGAGKSSIARLIDYCLGGELDLSPALQSEFVSATLHVTVNDIPLSIERPREAENVLASWTNSGQQFDLVLPSRKPAGEVIEESHVEVLSDLIFYLIGVRPPRVRRSKTRTDSDLTRLSLRDLLWYCYLDQDNIDSTFFHLDAEANPFKRNKSRDVLRFILGFHQERVAELESELQNTRERRLQLLGAAESLEQALEDADVASEEDIGYRVHELGQQRTELDQEIAALQERHLSGHGSHGVDQLRERARTLAFELEAIDEAIPEVERAIDQDRRHINELLMLGLKVQRGAAARAVLGGVVFEACPRCAQPLPQRSLDECQVCGQQEPSEGLSNVSPDILEQDTKARVSELEESVQRHKAQLNRMRRRRREFADEKQSVDVEISSLMNRYDSAYLSAALTYERHRAELGQQIKNLRLLVKLPRKVQELYERADELKITESEIRRQLGDAREAAETDHGNVLRLQELFLECLVRARVPGINPDDQVQINTTTFLPEVMDPELGEITVTSFANLSSGGKKTLFKACFALAIHRLATEIGAILPTFLIIDSPMKNISERENQTQFEGFHELVYRLAKEEISNTQVLIIDKEYLSPPEDVALEVRVRHMKPEDAEHPPLIPYYRGH